MIAKRLFKLKDDKNVGINTGNNILIYIAVK